MSSPMWQWVASMAEPRKALHCSHAYCLTSIWLNFRYSRECHIVADGIQRHPPTCRARMHLIIPRRVTYSSTPRRCHSLLNPSIASRRHSLLSFFIHLSSFLLLSIPSSFNSYLKGLHPTEGLRSDPQPATTSTTASRSTFGRPQRRLFSRSQDVFCRYHRDLFSSFRSLHPNLHPFPLRWNTVQCLCAGPGCIHPVQR